MSAHDVLEHNLARLFARAFRPVRPSAEFRSRLANLLAEAGPLAPSADRATANVTPNVTTARATTSASTPARAAGAPQADSVRGTAWKRALLAASVVGALAAGYLAWRPGTRPERSPAEIVTDGGVALWTSEDGAWREIERSRTARGFELARGSSCRVRTSAEPFRLRSSTEAVVVVGAASEVRVEHASAGTGPRVELERGSVTVENLAGRQSWTIDVGAAQITLDSGVLDARLADCPAGTSGPCALVLLERGVASVSTERGVASMSTARGVASMSTERGVASLDTERGVASVHGRALTVGVETLFGEGRVLSAAIDASERTSARTPVSRSPAPPPEPQAQPTPSGFGTITGTLPRSEGEGGIGRATVTLLRRERLPAVSTPKIHAFEGTERFSIHPVKPGTYDVFVELDGHAPWRRAGLEVAAEETVEIAVDPMRGASVQGRVLSASGAPIENALVIVEDEVPAQVIAFDGDDARWSARARTDPDGAFRLEHVSPGAHVLRATAAGHAAAWHALPAERSAREAGQEIVLRLDTPGRIAGTVARDDGTPWRGAIVIASHMPSAAGTTRFSYGAAVADELGRYEIVDLPEGDYVLLNALDANPGRETMTSRQVHVAPGATTSANLPEMARGTRFEGRLVDETGAVVGALDVTLQPAAVRDGSQWKAQRADADGRFVFQGLAAGDYSVYVGPALAEGFVAIETLDVPPDGSLRHDVVLPAGLVHGTAVGPEGPLAGAFVLLERAERDTFVFAGRGLVDDAGAFTFAHVPPGTYRVIAYPRQAHLAFVASLELWVTRASPVVTCGLRAERGAVLALSVLGADDRPVADVALTFHDEGARAVSFSARDVTGPDGRFVAAHLPAGRWTVRARASDGRATQEIVQLDRGDERELVLRLP